MSNGFVVGREEVIVVPAVILVKVTVMPSWV